MDVTYVTSSHVNKPIELAIEFRVEPTSAQFGGQHLTGCQKKHIDLHGIVRSSFLRLLSVKSRPSITAVGLLSVDCLSDGMPGVC
jgi:hypothetical protein